MHTMRQRDCKSLNPRIANRLLKLKEIALGSESLCEMRGFSRIATAHEQPRCRIRPTYEVAVEAAPTCSKNANSDLFSYKGWCSRRLQVAVPIQKTVPVYFCDFFICCAGFFIRIARNVRTRWRLKFVQESP